MARMAVPKNRNRQPHVSEAPDGFTDPKPNKPNTIPKEEAKEDVLNKVLSLILPRKTIPKVETYAVTPNLPVNASEGNR